MDKKHGVIYILTNPSFPEYVKIGYADDIDRRLSELNRTECTPFAFRVYATYAVQTRLTDLKIHQMIDRINPTLRSIDNVNGKKRIREFYAMSAEDAYLMFEAMAEIHGTTKLLKKVRPDKKQEEEEATANEVKEITREKLSPFSFDLVQIAPGEEVEFWYTTKLNSGIVCKVADSKHIEYEGELYSLSSFATKMLQSKHGVQGPRYFKYKGEWLNDIRNRLGV
ncbi:MAG TPA: GIY-YIG nuclease family protein [Candidatus Butyricicoccus stercorigallinarum]|nr:GIY-YIG nuclease family protein [Candidatus Butyricicoccus stercorigallinarum]